MPTSLNRYARWGTQTDRQTIKQTRVRITYKVNVYYFTFNLCRSYNKNKIIFSKLREMEGSVKLDSLRNSHGLLTCQLCYKNFFTQTGIKLHQCRHSSDLAVTCTQCNHYNRVVATCTFNSDFNLLH